jgi:hypothetical protein
MKRTVAALICAAALARPAGAETLRCGNKLIQPGDSAGEVLAKCGEPTSRYTISEPIRARNAGGGTRVVGTTEIDVWRYDRGSRSFPAVLKFEGGVLKTLEFEKS